MRYIGKGRMRIAFKVGKYAVKFPYNINGIKACFEELQIWIKNKAAPIAPIKFAIPGLCNVMPYYETPFTGRKPLKFISGLNKIGITDLHPYNIRMDKGSPVAIDYAVNRSSHGQGEPTGGW